MMIKYHKKDVEKILLMSEKGMYPATMSRVTGISITTIRNWLKDPVKWMTIYETKNL